MPVINLENARDHYDEWHRNIAGREDEDIPTSPWHDMARRHLPADLTGKKVLEIGCGRGGFSKVLAGLGATLVASDFSQAAVEVTSILLRKCVGNPTVEVADIQYMSHADDTFDFVVSLETLEHVPDPRRALAELVRVARPGGVLIISTPNYFGIMGIYRWYRERTGRPWNEGGQPICHPLRLIDRVRDLRRLGCHIVAVEGCGHYLYIPGRNPVRIRWLDRLGPLTKWFAAHGLTVAIKQ